MPSFRRPGGLSVRTRVLAAVVSLSALGLAVAGGVALGLQRGEITQNVDDSLRRSVNEFSTLAEIGIDPETGRDFTEADQLVRTAMARTSPAANEGMVGIVDGRVQLAANSSVPLRLEQDRQLIDRILAMPPTDRIELASIDTDRTTYRVVTVPVQLSSDPAQSTFVLAFDYEAEMEELNSIFRTYALIALIAIIMIAGVGWLVAGRLLAPVRLVRETARNITETDLSLRIPISGNDDLSELSRTFNEMLDRLQASMTAQRQLLDDVGHELRTPITIVQGHLELQDAHDPEDIDSVRAVALDELDRMRLLVDDLVTLAAADRPEFARPRPTEVGRLTDDVLDKARTLGDRCWSVDARTEDHWSLDPRRITQAWLQLAANAVKFSSPGSRIALGSRSAKGQLRLWVRDEGAGIAAADQQRIFERFARGTNSTRAEGSGLGLPIVSAIAAAHGGRVELASAPGQGSTFTIVIAEHQPEQEETA